MLSDTPDFFYSIQNLKGLTERVEKSTIELQYALVFGSYAIICINALLLV